MIIEIHFSKLTTLALINLKLASIELIAFLNMESLKQLMLETNKITSIKPLAKHKWNDLRHLSLYKNKMRQMEIHRIKMGNAI
jgi:hypothetical protein